MPLCFCSAHLDSHLVPQPLALTESLHIVFLCSAEGLTHLSRLDPGWGPGVTEASEQSHMRSKHTYAHKRVNS